MYTYDCICVVVAGLVGCEAQRRAVSAGGHADMGRCAARYAYTLVCMYS